MGTEIVPFHITLTINAVGVGNLVSVTPPGAEMGTVETTHHGQADFWRRFRGTLVDGGEVPAQVQCTPEQYADLFEMVNPEDGPVQCVIVVPGDTDITITFDCLVTSVAPGEAGIDNLLMADIKLKVSGPIAIT